MFPNTVEKLYQQHNKIRNVCKSEIPVISPESLYLDALCENKV